MKAVMRADGFVSLKPVRLSEKDNNVNKWSPLFLVAAKMEH